MIACADGAEAPRRLLLGRDAVHRVRAVLGERLAALDRQREVALSTDVDDEGASRSVAAAPDTGTATVRAGWHGISTSSWQERGR